MHCYILRLRAWWMSFSNKIQVFMTLWGTALYFVVSEGSMWRADPRRDGKHLFCFPLSIDYLWFFFISSSRSFRHSLSEWTFSCYLSASKPQNHCCFKSWAKMYNVIRGKLGMFVSGVGLYKAIGIYHYSRVRITAFVWSLNVALFCSLLPLEN